MAAEYPKKYWWVILIVVPVVIAVVGIFPDLISRISKDEGGSEGPQIILFQATPSTVRAGDRSTLQWQTRDASEVRLNGRLVTLDGNRDVRPEASASYTLIAISEAGKTDSETIDIEVTPSPSEESGNTNDEAANRVPAEYYPPAKVKLRSEPTTLSDAQVKAMLIEQGFYARYINPSARGFPNEFELRLVENEEVVVDFATHLMWKRQGSDPVYTWYRAGEHVIELNRMRYAGYADWRLPTIEEIASLMEAEKTAGSGHVDPIFELPPKADCWSGDRKAYDTAQDTAWLAGFSYGGFVHGGHAGNRACVLAVRSVN
jgi:hypothetical protein